MLTFQNFQDLKDDYRLSNLCSDPIYTKVYTMQINQGIFEQ